jgi:hypothetical protein
MDLKPDEELKQFTRASTTLELKESISQTRQDTFTAQTFIETTDLNNQPKISFHATNWKGRKQANAQTP